MSRGRHGRVLVILAALAATACGKKGDPLPPLRPVPGRVANLTARVDGASVELRFTVPAANQDNTTPAAIERVEIYGGRASAGAPPLTSAQLRTPKYLRGTIEVRRPDAPATGPAAARPAPGDPARFTDKLDPSLFSASSAPSPAPPPAAAAAAATAAARPPAAPAPPVMRYLAVGVAGRSRQGPPSDPVDVPLTAPPAPPTSLALGYDDRTLTLTWKAAAPAQSFLVYAADATGAETAPRQPLGDPVTADRFETPVAFGQQRCFVVRAVRTTVRVTVVSEPAGPACTTPVDTFPPPAPTGLQAGAVGGVVTLVWDRVEASDLAGYVVLRGEGGGGTLQQLTRTPVTDATYRDETVRPGVTYVYAVVAVDAAGNLGGQSNRETVTVR